MQLPSLTLILVGAVTGYVVYSMYIMWLVFTPPPCTNEQFCIKAFLSDKPKLQLHLFTSIQSRPLQQETTKVFSTDDFDYSKHQDIPIELDIPRRTRQNGTLYMHVIFVPSSSPHDGSYRDILKDQHVTSATFLITEYSVPKAKTFKLLSDEKQTNEKNMPQSKQKIITHLRSKIIFTMMTDDIPLPADNLPYELARNMKIAKTRLYLPFVNFDFLQSRHSDLVEIGPKSYSTNVTVSYNPITIGKLRLMMHVQEAMQSFKTLGFSAKDIDEVKGIFADTNIYLLLGTMFIAAMHLLFDFLAFKNDVSFWRSKRSLAGLSTRTVLWRAFSQSVIFLYLLEEVSSSLVVIPAGIGTIIEIWKAKKILKAEIVWCHTLLPRIKFNWNKCTAAEAKTQEFDAQSMRYLSYLMYPLVIGGAVYSLLYQPHKGWYSWTIQSMANGVYAFGFLFMLPQLFVNYKLKSVAHLPWRAFMYKAFNTFIDDIFAFIITMPVAHRVACFRDDAVFLVYLYQRWLYPVDKSRIDAPTMDADPVDAKEITDKKED